MNPDPDALRGLADLESDVSPKFVAGVRRKIERRTTASQLAQLSWTMPGAIFVEFWHLILHLLTAAGGGKGKSS